MKPKGKLFIIILSLISSSLLSGCYDRREVDDLSYVIGIGFDKGTIEPLRLSVQYAIPTAMGDGGGGGGGKDEEAKSLGLVTVEAATIYSGINMVNNFVGKQLNMSHAKVAIFSEDVAKSEQVGKYLHAMERGREFRPNVVVAVSKGSAEDYLKSVKPKQEINPAKYYELKFSNYKFTGFYSNTQFYRFYNNSGSGAAQAVATIVGVNKNSSSKDIDAGKTTSDTGKPEPIMGDYRAGDLPRAGDIKGETLGLAVFNGTKMVGELDGTEATWYLVASGEYQNSYLTFEDPKDANNFVNLKVTESRRPSYNVRILNGKPFINLKVMLEGDLLSIQSGANYEIDPDRSQLEIYIENYVRGQILNLLNKTKTLSVDICGFGRYARINFLDNEQWSGYKWLSKYKDAEFNVEVDMKIRRPGLMIRSLSPKSAESEGG